MTRPADTTAAELQRRADRLRVGRRRRGPGVADGVGRRRRGPGVCGGRRMTTARWSTLAAAVAGLLGGVMTAGDDRLSAALFATGMLFLGAWLVLLVRGGQ